MIAADSAAGLVSLTVPGAVSFIAHAPETRETVEGEPAKGDPVTPPFQASTVHAIVVEAENIPAREMTKQVNLNANFMALNPRSIRSGLIVGNSFNKS